MPACAVIAGFTFLGSGGLAFFLQVFFGAEAFICLAGSQQTVCRCHMLLSKFRLKIRAFIPVEPQPLQAVDDTVNGCLGRSLFVGIFNAQNQFAVMLPGKQPVEQHCPGPADVKITRGAGREANANVLHGTLQIETVLTHVCTTKEIL